ncbi:hypothetical protein JCM10213_009216 [Rhodosporidiobolus nylandii]
MAATAVTLRPHPIHLLPPPAPHTTAEQAVTSNAQPALKVLLTAVAAEMLLHPTPAAPPTEQIPSLSLEEEPKSTSPLSATFPARSAGPCPLSPVFEEDEDLLVAFPLYSSEELRQALDCAEKEGAKSGMSEVRIKVVDEDELRRRGAWREVFAGEEDDEVHEGVRFAVLPIAKHRPSELSTLTRRPVTPSPIFLPLPSPSSSSSGSSAGSSPSSASFSDAPSSSGSSRLSAPSTARTTPATSAAPSPTGCSFPSSRASSSIGSAKYRGGGDLSRGTTRTVDSTSSSWSGKSTARFLKKLFLPNYPLPTSTSSSVPSSTSISRASSFFSSRPSSPVLSAPASAEVLAAVTERLALEAKNKDVDAKEALKKLRRMENERKKSREREMEERLEREWREKRERRRRR